MIRVSRTTHIATLTIDRPSKKNALTHAMWRELRAVIDGISNTSDIRVLVLKGHGGNFSAGADIGEFDMVRAKQGTAISYEQDNCDAFEAIRDCPIPTIAAIQGVCFGGGFGIAAACDLRFGDTAARFCVPPAKLGLAYPVDAMQDIVSALGPQFAKMMAYGAQTVDAETACTRGFLLDIFPPDEFNLRITEIAQIIADNAPLSNRATKASINAVLSGDPVDRENAVKLGSDTFESADYAEGRLAFREKRKPVFRGE